MSVPGGLNMVMAKPPGNPLPLATWPTANKELAWGTGAADRNKVEWTSFIGGPSLGILTKNLDQAIADKTIPYAPTLGAYITADDATARYTALKAWYTARGHFWDGTGPYYLASVDLNAGSAVVKNNPDYVDLADRWSRFGEAPLAEAALDGPSQVKIGAEAAFNVTLTKKTDGAPYPSADVKEVKFLLYDDKGETVYVGAGNGRRIGWSIHAHRACRCNLQARGGHWQDRSSCGSYPRCYPGLHIT